MITTIQMLLVIIIVIFIGAFTGVFFYLIKKMDKHSQFSVLNFSENYVAPKMKNTDISIDDIVKNFELID